MVFHPDPQNGTFLKRQDPPAPHAKLRGRRSGGGRDGVGLDDFRRLRRGVPVGQLNKVTPVTEFDGVHLPARPGHPARAQLYWDWGGQRRGLTTSAMDRTRPARHAPTPRNLECAKFLVVLDDTRECLNAMRFADHARRQHQGRGRDPVGHPPDEFNHWDRRGRGDAGRGAGADRGAFQRLRQVDAATGRASTHAGDPRGAQPDGRRSAPIYHDAP